MVNEVRPTAEYTATQPFDSTDLPKFGQLSETAKDTFAQELAEYFEVTDQLSDKELTIPNIQKFSVGSSKDDLETVVNIIMSYADTPQKFPMISITSTSSREKHMNMGSNYVATVQYAPSVLGSGLGPWDITSPSTSSLSLQLTTWPGGTEASAVTSTVVLAESLFSDPTNVDIDTLIRVVNKTQALYYRFEKDNAGHLRISAGGVSAPSNPNYIEVAGGSASLLSMLGLTVGDSDIYSNIENPPKNRYGMSSDMTINIDVVADSINTRGELADLVQTFFQYYMQSRRFEFFGRSYFDRELTNKEWYHIALKGQFSWSTEVTRPRQGGEQYEQIYAIRGSVPIFIEDFVDKDKVLVPVWGSDTEVQSSRAEDADVTGDYGLNHE